LGSGSPASAPRADHTGTQMKVKNQGRKGYIYGVS
jgi:hypothetical protein